MRRHRAGPPGNTIGARPRTRPRRPPRLRASMPVERLPADGAWPFSTKNGRRFDKAQRGAQAGRCCPVADARPAANASYRPPDCFPMSIAAARAAVPSTDAPAPRTARDARAANRPARAPPASPWPAGVHRRRDSRHRAGVFHLQAVGRAFVVVKRCGPQPLLAMLDDADNDALDMTE